MRQDELGRRVDGSEKFGWKNGRYLMVMEKFFWQVPKASNSMPKAC